MHEKLTDILHLSEFWRLFRNWLASKLDQSEYFRSPFRTLTSTTTRKECFNLTIFVFFKGTRKAQVNPLIPGHWGGEDSKLLTRSKDPSYWACLLALTVTFRNIQNYLIFRISQWKLKCKKKGVRLYSNLR